MPLLAPPTATSKTTIPVTNPPMDAVVSRTPYICKKYGTASKAPASRPGTNVQARCVRDARRKNGSKQRLPSANRAATSAKGVTSRIASLATTKLPAQVAITTVSSKCGV